MSDKPLQDDEFFLRLTEEPETPPAETRASSRLKARVYSMLLKKQRLSGPLRSLGETRRADHRLCVFESFWERSAPGTGAKAFNCCSICHARVLAERLERAPIYWGHCPYVAFGKK